MNVIQEITYKNFYHLMDYKVLIFDVAGTICDGIVDSKQTIKFLQYLLDNKKRICFLSNSSNSSKNLSAKIEEFNLIEKGNQIGVYTSGQFFYHLLNSKKISGHENRIPRFFHLGQEKTPIILRNMEELFYPIDESEIVLVSEAFEPKLTNFYLSKLNKILEKKMKMLCINPDIEAPLSKVRLCPGYIASAFQKIGGEVLYIGKPDIKIFEWLLRNEYELQKIRKEDVIMIGDNVKTDILGANNFGIDSMLVLTGITNSLHKIDEINNYRPKYYCKNLNFLNDTYK